MLSPNTNIRVRKSRLSDAIMLSRVFRDAWRQTYLGILPENYLSACEKRRNTDWWRRAVCNRSGLATLAVNRTVVGYAMYGPARGHGHDTGELFEIYIVPDHQGLGFGEVLFESCRNRLDLRKRYKMVTWALQDNHQAVDFYWRRGGVPFAEMTEIIDEKPITKIGFQWC